MERVGGGGWHVIISTNAAGFGRKSRAYKTIRPEGELAACPRWFAVFRKSIRHVYIMYSSPLAKTIFGNFSWNDFRQHRTGDPFSRRILDCRRTALRNENNAKSLNNALNRY